MVVGVVGGSVVAPFPDPEVLGEDFLVLQGATKALEHVADGIVCREIQLRGHVDGEVADEETLTAARPK